MSLKDYILHGKRYAILLLVVVRIFINNWFYASYIFSIFFV